MDAAVVISVLKTLAPKIFAFLQEYHYLRRNLERDIRYIRDELQMIDAAIKDYHRRSWRCSDGTNNAEESWIQRVRDLAYSMQDCMDRFLPRVKGGRLKTAWVRTKFAKKIQELRKKSEEIYRLIKKYTVGGQASTSGASRPTSEVPETQTPAADLVGIDVPRDELLELMREDEPKQLKVISIVGFGGLGKTTLAWQVHDSVTVGEEYEPRVWVHASEKGAVDVLREILEKVLGTRVHDGYCDNLIKCLSECLSDKRFLIVIDDMRKEDCWNIIKYAFPKNMAVSSRVIVTTANQSIANACSAGNGHVYVMRTLDEEHSKRLFFKEASSSLEYYEPAEQVLKKCDGLPLALATTAQLLQSKYQLTPKGCADLCRNLGEDVEKEETLARMKHALLQSYYSLPGQQEMLFLLYLGIFPSGRPVRRKRLIRRWLAEGFVEADYRRVAINNFKELMKRSIIQHVDMSNNTEAKTCQTHGMVLEFILHKSMCDNFITLLYDHQARLPDKIRWLSLHHNGAADRLKTIDLSLVRSLTIFGKADEHVLKSSKYKLLRVLDLEECETLNDKHVKNICKLLRLRYLSLGGNITMLPKEISKLKFLQTLDVRSARVKILPIPIEVIKLPFLIHLLGAFSFPDVGKEMKKLQTFLSENSNLETLAGFVADQSPAFPQLMSHMNRLKKVKVWCGEPTADGSNNFTHLSGPLQNFIQKGTKVMDDRSLSLSFEGCWKDFLDFRHEDNCCYLRSLKLHGELQSLPLFVTKLGSVTELCLSSPDQLSGDVLAALSNVSGLLYLKLITRQLDRFVIKQGELKNLQRLCIEVQSMACLENQEGALPQLESLWLLCKGLNGLCGAEIEHLTCLKEVALDDGVSEKTKKEWKEAAKKHLKQPRVSLLGRKDVDQNRMQMGVGSEPRDQVSESRAAPSPEVAQMPQGSAYGGQQQMQNQVFLQQEVQDTTHLQNFQPCLYSEPGQAPNVDIQGPSPNNPSLLKGIGKEVSLVNHNRPQGNEMVDNTIFAAADSVEVTCYKCCEKGHILKDCPNKVLCNVCGKDSHLSSKCAWLRQPKPVSKFVGYAAAGLGCFVVEHARDLMLEDKNNSMALVTVVSGNVNASQLAHDFELTFPWKWEWNAKENGPGKFLMRFPSAARIGEVSLFSSVTLRGSGAQVSVARWTTETMAVGQLHTVWVKVIGVPDTMKNFYALCEIASSLGVVQEVDMDLLEKTDEVRVKVGVKDPFKIPSKIEVTTPKLLLYDVFFSIESVVEIGWSRRDHQDNPSFAAGIKVSGGENEEMQLRDTKRHKSLIAETVSKKDSGKGCCLEAVKVAVQPDKSDEQITTPATEQNPDTLQCQRYSASLQGQNKASLIQEDDKLLMVGSQEDNDVTDSQEKVQFSRSEDIDGNGTQESDINNFARQVGVVVENSQELESFVDDLCQQQGGTNLSNPRSSRLKENEEEIQDLPQNPNHPVLEWKTRQCSTAAAPAPAEGSVIAIHGLDEWSIQIDEANRTNKLVVILFTQSSCRPAVEMAPVFADLAKKFPNVVFLKADLDVDETGLIAEGFGVDASPTFLFMKGGIVKDRLRGGDKEELVRKLELQMAQ